MTRDESTPTPVSEGRQLDRLLDLARRPDLYRGELGPALQEITRSACDLLDVDRVNIWQLDDDGRTIVCLDHFERDTGEHDQGAELHAGDYPNYFEALPRELVLAVADAPSDPRTAELADDYLQPQGIGALLDAPVRREGKVVGVVCHEHVGPPREWTEAERQRAGLVADFVALALESRDRRELQQKYHNLFDLSYDMIFLVDARTGRFLETNAVAADRLGYPQDELVGTSYQAVHPEEALSRAEEGFREVVEKGQTRFLTRFRTREGENLPVEIVAKRLELGGERVVQAVARDMTEWMETREALQSSERRYRELFERNVAGVFRTTREGEILEVNRSFARILGYDSPEELREAVEADVGRLWVDEDERRKLMDRLEAEGAVENYELRLRRKDGSTVWVLENSALVTDPGGGEVLAGTLIDVTERKQLREELERLAYHDSLTGVPNRRLLKDRGRSTLSRARREASQVGLVYLDLVQFKRINDTLGHASGDRVLVETARRLAQAARDSDTVARVGGDEFAVLLADVDGTAGAGRAAERLAEVLEPAFDLGGRTVQVDARLGLAVFPDHATDYDALLSAADAAMYQPEPGTPRDVHLYQGTPAKSERDELVVEEEIRRGLEEEQFLLYFQPVVRCGDGTPEGAEALLRWRHPDRGLVAAGEFIHVAEHSSLVHSLDRWVLSECLCQMAAWQQSDVGLEWVSVNLSAHSLRDPELVEFVAGELEAREMDPSRLVVEVTERMAMRNPQQVSDALRDLRERGVRIALDDFGTGHSALAHLQRFPVDFLKMDGFFTQALDREGPGKEGRLAEAVIQLGRTLGTRVVAEGVETRAQRRRLKETDCHLLQGYFVGEPVPAEELQGARSSRRR